MKVILEIFVEILGSIAEAAVEACPLLIIFLIAAFLFFDGGCLAEIFGVFLIPVGVIVLAVTCS